MKENYPNCYIFPSIISKSQKEFEERYKKVKFSSKKIQLDVMDGKFVKNTCLNFDFTIPKLKKIDKIKTFFIFSFNSINPFSKKEIEAHLMVKNPEEWIKKYSKKADSIIFHVEPFLKERDKNKKVTEIIRMIKDRKKKVGIAINPETPTSEIESFLDKIEKVLILCVNPGRYGAEFIPKTLEKVKHLRKIKSKMDIGVDGGMSEKNIKSAKIAGANHFAMGSYFQNSKNPIKSMRRLKSIIQSV